MPQKILYFTEGPKATVSEIEDIDKINAFVAPPFTLGIRNAQEGASYGYGPEHTDYVAGSPPTPYDNQDAEDGPVYPVFDPDAPPIPVSPTQYIVNDGEEYAVVGGTVSVAVADGDVTFAFTSSGG